MHYSVSRLPETGYQPRLADDRVGHFLTVIKDFSKTGADDQFVRYINRWDLRKAKPGAEVSPPVTPIVVWIEKTVPYKFRGAVRDGILEWNKAFERVGFSNAIEVRQQPDDATWDPEDIRYNTFRWITANAGFAMGPSRTNPLTGQILDADIIFDADFIEIWTRRLETWKPDAAVEPLGLPLVAFNGHEDATGLPFSLAFDRETDSEGLGRQFAFGALAMAAGAKPVAKDQIEKLLVEGVKSVVTHEVGHTLGLRHNFKSSALLTMDEVNDPEKNRTIGLTASIMDYTPVNISPKGKKQGDYFSRTIGPYDYWAIEYAYRPLPGGTDGEVPQLAKIASRCTEPALQYATDEDTGPLAPDPSVNRFDLSKDPVEFARWRVELISQLLPVLVDRAVEPGEGYDRARNAFGILLNEHARAMGFVAREIGGVYVNRDHRGDPKARPPFVVTEPKKQREALEFLEQQVFGPEAYRFPDKLLDFLGTTHWKHWGMKPQGRPDFPLNQTVLMMQDHSGPCPLADHVVADPRFRSEDARRPGRLHGGGTPPRADRIDLQRDRSDRKAQGGKVHRPQAGDQRPPPQLAAALLRAAGRAGDGHCRRAERLPNSGNGGVGQSRGTAEARARRQGAARHVQPLAPRRSGHADS